MAILKLGKKAYTSEARLESVREIEEARKARLQGGEGEEREEGEITERQDQPETEADHERQPGEEIARPDQKEKEKEKEVEESEILILNNDALDCSICYNPLRPPLFQCAFGHVVCSSCMKKLSNKCHLCSRTTGRIRSYALENILESARVFCPNKNLGCDAQIPYYLKNEHKSSCCFSPCFCPDESCRFASSANRILDHGKNEHGWSVHDFQYGAIFAVCLPSSCPFKVLVDQNDRMFLLKMARKPRGVAFSVVLVQQPGSGRPEFSYEITVKRSEFQGVKRGKWVKFATPVISSTLEKGIGGCGTSFLVSHKSLPPALDDLTVCVCIHEESA